MEGRTLLLQLLLLLSPAANTLHAYSVTTASPHNANLSLESLNFTLHDYKDMLYSFHTEHCWEFFVEQMANISKADWCEWKIIRRPYSLLRKCLEDGADKLILDYPNALAEQYIIFSHSKYFLNCTMELNSPLLDPPEHVLLPLIITPICLIPFLVTLVVLKSKDGEMQS